MRQIDRQDVFPFWISDVLLLNQLLARRLLNRLIAAPHPGLCWRFLPFLPIGSMSLNANSVVDMRNHLPHRFGPLGKTERRSALNTCPRSE